MKSMALKLRASFFKAGGYAPEMLEPGKEILHQMTVPVQVGMNFRIGFALCRTRIFVLGRVAQVRYDLFLTTKVRTR